MSAVEMWLSDGKAQGFSDKSIKDREGSLRRFCWWLENEEEAPLTLEALTPERIRFLAYCREARPEGRFGSDNPLAQRQARSS
jgi:hypothetical protein